MRLKKAEQRFRLTTRDYARLAAFRRALRGFLRFSEAAAGEAGLTTQHYQAMLVLRASPEGQSLTINDLAHELLVKHNSAVGLVDRLSRQNLVVRTAATDDRRKVELRLTPRGREVLARLASVHAAELRRIGPIFKKFFSVLSRS